MRPLERKPARAADFDEKAVVWWKITQVGSGGDSKAFTAEHTLVVFDQSIVDARMHM